MIIDSYLWLILLCYVSVVCVNGGITFFREKFKKFILLVWKLWMNCINSVKNYKYAFLVKKPKKWKT